MKKWTFAIAALMTVTSVFAEAPTDVIATVNGHQITRSQFEEYHLQNLKFVGQRVVTKEVSLNDMINKELAVEKAKKSGVDKDPAVIARIEDLLSQTQITKDVEGDLKKITVSDDEVKKYYDDNKEYRTAHILYRLRAEPSKEDVTGALSQSMEIYTVLQKDPESFAKLANKFSQTTAAPVGGDLGFQPAARLAPEYFAAIKGQKVGFISKPVRSQMGYHIIKVLGEKKFDQIDKNLYKKIIYDQKRDAILENYFKNLQKGADIKINKSLL